MAMCYSSPVLTLSGVLMRPIAVLVLALTLTTAAAGVACARQRRPAAPARPAAEPARSERVAALLTALAHDSMEGRDTGTRGAAAAARLIAAELQRAGVEPAGDSGYFQRVPLSFQTVTLPSGQTRRRMALLPGLADRDSVSPANRTATQAVNVIGIIRGADPALREEAVVLTAHYDHVGIGQPVNGDSIYNGADDDASGTVAVIEMARIIAAGPAPRRSVVVVLVTGEERGLLGTNWYIANPVIPLERTAANLNMEMIARPDSLAGGHGKGWLTGYDRSSMGQILRDGGVPLVPDPRPAQRFFERSDNIAFARRGIPAHTISSFNLHTDYHRPSDEAHLADAAHMAAVINASAQAARLLADGPAPTWTPGDPFDRPRGSVIVR
jgi:hypothetical protein